MLALLAITLCFGAAGKSRAPPIPVGVQAGAYTASAAGLLQLKCLDLMPTEGRTYHSVGAAACGAAGRALVSVVTTVEYAGGPHSCAKPLSRLRPFEGHLPACCFLLLPSPDSCHVSLQATPLCKLSSSCIRLRYSMRQQCLLQL